MTKVCHVTSAHNSDDTRIFYKECVSLAKSGYETYLVAPGESYERSGVHVIGTGERPAGRFKRMTQGARKAYRTALELDADIYHLHDPELLPYGLKLKKKGKKVIFDSHENTLEQMEEKTYIPKLLRPGASMLYRAFAGNAFRRCDAIISVTPHVCKLLEAYSPTVRMVTNYPILTPVSDKIQIEKDDAFHIGFAGGVTEQWSHVQILEAVASMSAVKYEVWGGIASDYQAELQGAKGCDQAVFYGKVPHSEIANRLATLNAGMALCQYSRNSGGALGTLGNTKIFEYMAAGLPIICTDFVLWREIVNKYRCGIYVSPTNIADIANAICYLRDHPEEALRMGESGRRAVEQEFNWRTQEVMLLSLYQEVLI